MSAGIRPEALLEESTWLKRLALTLAANGDDADDLVQETWIAAWRANPDASRPLRPWLSKVLRDQSRMRRRSDARRVQREGGAPEGESTGPDEILEQVRLHRLLADLVLELDEPFRSTILSRFVEGLTSAAIAKRLGIPESTVRSRLREGLARLRSRLDEINGERKAWAPAVLAFAGKGGAVAKSAKATVAVLALIALLLASVALWWWRRDDEKRGTVTHDISAGTERNQPTWKNRAHAELRSEARPPGWFSQEGAPRRRIAGTVVVDGEPVAGAEVRLEDESSRAGLVPRRIARTGTNGSFDFGEQMATRFEVGAHIDGRVATVRSVDLRDPLLDAEHIVITLQPCIAGLRGRVLDASAGPVQRAEVLVQGVIGTESDKSGAFEICVDAQGEAPETRRVRVRASGYGTIELIAPLAGIVERDLMLSPEGTITGRVVNARGEGVSMANVRVAWDEAAPRPGSEHPASARAVSDPDGRFELAGLSGGRLRVEAIARGLGATPVVVELAAGEAKELQLVMTERAVIRGRVLDGGTPVPGVRVFDRSELPTYLPRARVLSAINEAVTQPDGTFILDGVAVGTLSLDTSPPRLRTAMPIQVHPGEQSLQLDVEQLGRLSGTVSRNGALMPYTLIRASGTNWVNVRTVEADSNGRFEIDGLDVDDYDLYAYNAVAGAFTKTDSKVHVDVGTRGVAIDLRYGGSISGTVVDMNGAVVTGAFVRFTATSNDDGSRCITDRAGRFRCTSLMGGREYRAEVSGSEASPSPYPLIDPGSSTVRVNDGNDEVSGLKLVVDARRVRIKGVVVDEQGNAVLDARVFANPGLSPWASIPTSVTNLRGEFELRDLPPGSYGLQAQALDGAKAVLDNVAGGTSNARFVIETPSCNSSHESRYGQMLRVPPAVPNQPAFPVVWDDSVQLLGWDAPLRVSKGQAFRITLVWKVLEPLDRSWKIFVHVEGPKVRVNGDHEPVGGQCLTSTWKAGDVIVDRTEVRIDPAFDPGPYQIWIGFFSGWEPTWKNLPLSEAPASSRDEHQRLRLTTIQVTD